jgi:hypothetical protein
MKPTQEFTRRHELVEEYYLDGYGRQRVKRTLISDGDTLATEDYPAMSKMGGLYAIQQGMEQFPNLSEGRHEVHHKSGAQYRGLPCDGFRVQDRTPQSNIPLLDRM